MSAVIQFLSVVALMLFCAGFFFIAQTLHEMSSSLRVIANYYRGCVDSEEKSTEKTNKTHVLTEI